MAELYSLYCRLGGDPNLQVTSPFGTPSSKFPGEVDLEDFSGGFTP